MHSAEVDLKVGHNTPLLRSTAPQQQIGFTGGFFPRLSRLVWLRCVSFRGPGSLSGIVAVIAVDAVFGSQLPWMWLVHAKCQHSLNGHKQVVQIALGTAARRRRPANGFHVENACNSSYL